MMFLRAQGIRNGSRPENVIPDGNLQPARKSDSNMRFQIPGALRQFARGQSEIELEDSPATVKEALAALWKLCPGMQDRVVTEQGEVRQHVNIFVGEENIRYSGGLATRVSAESVITIVPAVSGGGCRNLQTRP
jgi:molybdopterin converting factor small subunit